MSQAGNFIIAGGPGSGTVTSLTAGTGITLTPSPITTTGSIALTIPVSIADGGTNATSMTTTDGVVYYDGTRLVTTAVGTSTYVLTSNGAGMAPSFQAASGGGIVTLDGDAGSATGTTVTISGGTTGLTTTASAATVDLTGTLTVGHGGTGAATFTSHGVLLGNTTSAITATAAGTTGQILTGVTGSAPTWQSPAASSITITGDSGGGLTGNSFTFTGGTTGLTFAGATATETLGGTLVVANGGTGDASFTAYAPICGGTTTTGVLQSASTGISNSGYVLTSTGSTSLPTWQASGGGGGGITSVGADTGTAVTGTTVSILAQGPTIGAGATMQFLIDGSNPTYIQLRTSDNSYNTIIGESTGSFPSPGNQNTGLGYDVMPSSNSSSRDNSAVGYNAMASLTSGMYNCAFGSESLEQLSSGTNNVSIGYQAMENATTAVTDNIAIGSAALNQSLSATQNVSIGSNTMIGGGSPAGNVAIGYNALSVGASSNNVAIGVNAGAAVGANDNVIIGANGGGGAAGLNYGTDNTLIGTNAGNSFNGTESSNILIGSGVAGQNSTNNVCYIGNGTGTGTGQLNQTFIAGVAGITTGVADAIPVLVSASTDQFGTITSSIKFKDNVQDMGASSDFIMSLRPVIFNYKADAKKSNQYGLIAEEVHEIMPSFTVNDRKGELLTVKYHELPILLLNEIKKLRSELNDLKLKTGVN